MRHVKTVAGAIFAPDAALHDDNVLFDFLGDALLPYVVVAFHLRPQSTVMLKSKHGRIFAESFKPLLEQLL